MGMHKAVTGFQYNGSRSFMTVPSLPSVSVQCSSLLPVWIQGSPKRKPEVCESGQQHHITVIVSYYLLTTRLIYEYLIAVTGGQEGIVS